MYPEALLEALGAQVALGELIEEPDLVVASRCEGWSVGDVLNHSVSVTLKFTSFARGETDRPRTPQGDHLAGDHRSALRNAADAARAAWPTADLGRTCHLPFGSFPASTAAGINLFDVLAHTWDIAGPTENTLRVPQHLWETGLRAAQDVIGPNRDLDHYGPHVATETTSPREAFLSFLGRTETPLDYPHA